MTLTSYVSASQDFPTVTTATFDVPGITLTGTSRMVLGFSHQRAPSPPTHTATLNGQAPTGTLFTALVGVDNYTWGWYWLDADLPVNGTYSGTLVSSRAFDTNTVQGSLTFIVGNDIDQLDPFRSTNWDFVLNGGNISNTVVTAVGDDLVDILWKRNTTDEALNGAFQTQQHSHVSNPEPGSVTSCHRLYVSTKDPADGGQMLWTSTPNRNLTQYILSIRPVTAAEYSGTNVVVPGSIAVGSATLVTLLPAEYSGATTAVPGSLAEGASEIVTLPPAAYIGTTTAKPGTTARGFASRPHTTRGGSLSLDITSTGSGELIFREILTGSGAPQADTATSAGVGLVSSSRTGTGSPQADPATVQARGAVTIEAQASGVADAWLETYFKELPSR